MKKPAASTPQGSYQGPSVQLKCPCYEDLQRERVQRRARDTGKTTKDSAGACSPELESHSGTPLDHSTPPLGFTRSLTQPSSHNLDASACSSSWKEHPLPAQRGASPEITCRSPGGFFGTVGSPGGLLNFRSSSRLSWRTGGSAWRLTFITCLKLKTNKPKRGVCWRCAAGTELSAQRRLPKDLSSNLCCLHRQPKLLILFD